MTDATLAVTKTPEENEAARKQAEQDLAVWYQKQQAMAILKEEEATLRIKVVNYYFPNGLKEGTNKCDLPEGWKLDVKGTINRKIDDEAEAAVRAKLKELYEVDLGDFIKYKPELALPVYRELVESVSHVASFAEDHPERIKREGILKLVHEAMIVAPGTPQVSLVAPKKPKVKTEV